MPESIFISWFYFTAAVCQEHGSSGSRRTGAERYAKAIL
jgi:hypothetical protein